LLDQTIGSNVPAISLWLAWDMLVLQGRAPLALAS